MITLSDILHLLRRCVGTEGQDWSISNTSKHHPYCIKINGHPTYKLKDQKKGTRDPEFYRRVISHFMDVQVSQEAIEYECVRSHLPQLQWPKVVLRPNLQANT